MVLSNGAYGLRCFESLKYFDRPSEILNFGDFLPPDPILLQEKLKNDQSITHVIIIHCETSSGILNPITEIAKIVEKEHRSLLIDSMSAFGAIPIDAGKIRLKMEVYLRSMIYMIQNQKVDKLQKKST